MSNLRYSLMLPYNLILVNHDLAQKAAQSIPSTVKLKIRTIKFNNYINLLNSFNIFCKQFNIIKIF